jgi:hypothetical protein
MKTRPPIHLIVAAIAIAILIVGAALAFVPWRPASPCACAAPNLFGVGDPVLVACPLSGNFTSTGCAVGDYAYHLTVERAQVPFGELAFRVEYPNGTTFEARGGEPGFSLLNGSGDLSAQSAADGGLLVTTQGWTYAGGNSAGTLLTNVYSILVDMGSANPGTAMYRFVYTVDASVSGFAYMAPS